jgi:hypothetical protein
MCGKPSRYAETHIKFPAETEMNQEMLQIKSSARERPNFQTQIPCKFNLLSGPIKPQAFDTDE